LHEVLEVFDSLRNSPPPRLVVRDGKAFVPLFLEEGIEWDALVDHVVAQLHVVAALAEGSR
jgi:hypothetical protein